MATTVDTIEPVDYLVVESPIPDPPAAPVGVAGPGRRGLVRILDLVVLRKEQDGLMMVLELTDVDGRTANSTSPSSRAPPPASSTASTSRRRLP
jgi:hypothetical protein